MHADLFWGSVRQQGGVTDVASMMALMGWNDYTNDPNSEVRASTEGVGAAVLARLAVLERGSGNLGL